MGHGYHPTTLPATQGTSTAPATESQTSVASGEFFPTSFSASSTQPASMAVTLPMMAQASHASLALSPVVGLGPPPILYEGVPDRVKAAIVAGEYVEITRLDKESYKQVAYNIKVGEADDDVTLQLAKDKEPKKKILTLEQWADLFVKYMAIYVAKHPKEAIHILSHYQTVRTLHRKGGDWLEYDRAFRKRKALSNYPWASVDQQAYTEALINQESPTQEVGFRNNQLFRPPQNTPYNIPFGFCRKYHTAKEGCTTTQCTWRHQCYQCNGGHKQSACPNGTKIWSATHPQTTRSARGGDSH